MRVDAGSTLADVCFAVCTALNDSGTVAVLTGGSAAAFYTPSRYQSRDADFVISLMPDPAAAAAALINLGFVERAGVYHHPESAFTIEFPPGPLSIGSELVERYDTIRREGATLHVLTRTDAVCDRLAAFYHWDDRGSLRVALDVARSGDIDLAKIERWSKAEGRLEGFAEFESGYQEREG